MGWKKLLGQFALWAVKQLARSAAEEAARRVREKQVQASLLKAQAGDLMAQAKALATEAAALAVEHRVPEEPKGDA